MMLNHYLSTYAKVLQQGPSTQTVQVVRQHDATPLEDFCISAYGVKLDSSTSRIAF